MSETSGLIDELSARLATSGEGDRTRMTAGVTDLLVGTAENLGAQQLDVFDEVLLRLADVIEVSARRALAERLSTEPNAPPRVIRRLARDEIVVARPLLVQSGLLSEADLITIARERGRDHMLAISERPRLSEPLTDVLIDEGDRVVINAVAANPGARFSARGFSALVARSSQDELLLAKLRDREDVPERHLPVLFELAKQAARQRIEKDGLVRDSKIVGLVVDEAARSLANEADIRAQAYRAACAEVDRLMRDGRLDERAMVGFARERRSEHAVAAVAMLVGVPLTLADRAVMTAGSDIVLLVARAGDMAWSSVRALLALRGKQAPGPAELGRMSDAYDKLEAATARRIVRFMHAREAASARKATQRR
jgi:uncharacterized protein (DUF2336 family)